MDAKGTEGKNYTYCYLERLKYVGIYWTFVKMVLEHNFILGRSCPYHSRVFLPPFPRASSLASFSYFPNPFFLKTTLTPVLPPSPPPIFFISDLLRSKSCGFSCFPAVQCFSCCLPLDCLFKRAQGRYSGTEKRKGSEWLETVSSESFNSQESKSVRGRTE